VTYTPPNKTDINVILSSGYIAPDKDSINVIMGAESGDTTSLEDFNIDIATQGLILHDFALDVAAYYESKSDVILDIYALSEKILNVTLDIYAGMEMLNNLPVDTLVAAQNVYDIPCDIYLSNGILTLDIAIDINVGDGSKIISMGLDLMAVSTIPEFKYVYAMSLNSVIKEVV